MIKTCDLIKNIDEKYVPMLEKVNIPDVTKCLAVWSGLDMNCLDEQVIINYLHTWAKNKYHIFELFGRELRTEQHFQLNKQKSVMIAEIQSLQKQYPAYALWLQSIRGLETNEIKRTDISYDTRDMISKLYPEVNIEGMAITHFFKKYLLASEQFVIDLAKIYENNKTDVMGTWSIDPVDILTASENPYNWSSCYMISKSHCDSNHSDGCVAAMLDGCSTIFYVWNKEGKTQIGNYTFKSTRYKMMRMFVDIGADFKTAYFHLLYPSHSDFDNEESTYLKDFRLFIENKMATYINEPDIWKKGYDDLDREYYYGYNEFNRGVMYAHESVIKEDGSKDIDWHKTKVAQPYSEPITCLCGCKKVLTGSDEYEESDEGPHYIGGGFICSNFEERTWCEEEEDYMNCDGDCEHCDIYLCNHPVCPITGERCHNCYDGYYEADAGEVDVCEACRDCSVLENIIEEWKTQRAGAPVVNQIGTDLTWGDKWDIVRAIERGEKNSKDYSVEDILSLYGYSSDHSEVSVYSLYKLIKKERRADGLM